MNNEIVLSVGPRAVRGWLAVIALGISAFTIVTSELAPVGMLGMLATGLHQSEAGAGLAVTAYGWTGALAALFSAWMPARFPRKPLLVLLMLILAVSSFLVAHSQTMGEFISARIAGAIAHGAFWAVIGSIVGQLVTTEQLGLATSVIFGGVSAASVLGVPLVSVMASSEGWRYAFSAISLLSLITAFALVWTLPPLSSPPAVQLNLWRGLFRNPQLPALYVATAVIISAHFAAFTYIQLLLTGIQGVPDSSVSALLLASGLAGLTGNVIAGKLIDRHLKTLIAGGLLVCASALILLGIKFIVPLPVAGVTLLLVLWGAAVAIIFVGLQTWVLQSVGEAVQPASALYVAIFNGAIGGGALAGGQLLAFRGVQGTALFSAALLLTGMLMVLRLKKP